MEFSVEMRPDHVMSLAVAIHTSLRTLPDNVRKQYGIKDEDIKALSVG